MSELKIKDFQEYQQNPFLEDVYESDVITRRDGSKMMATSVNFIDANGNAAPAFMRKSVSKYMDKREFVRITDEGIQIMAHLKLVEYRIFAFILICIKLNDLEVKIKIDDVKKFYAYKSRNPIYQGITGLLQKEMISRKKDSSHIYFINPLYFYKGTIVKEVFGYINNTLS